ncbi:hypothetical protein AMC99_00733 [Altererythrobacter epoxidivorans]|uniref:Uncharacterized protein n=1 Tax=Altererythrobacter epoxidivorans TaxID=361183 RepID=A0A0M5KZ75_9SPHN|nr:hypothetical protein AMC99_00733 [Altererythrobacter epoxidivorans]
MAGGTSGSEWGIIEAGLAAGWVIDDGDDVSMLAPKDTPPPIN